MRKWKCHKIVEAAKIVRIEPTRSDPLGRALILEDQTESVVEVTIDFMERHNPSVGDYLVRYSDGYLSISPTGAFEEGYALYESS